MMLNGQLYTQRLQELVNLYLFTDCFISLQSSEQILEFVPMIGSKSS